MAGTDNMCVGCELPLVRGQRYGIRRGQLWHSHCYVAFGGKTNRERDLERRIASLDSRLVTETAAHATTREQREEQRSRALMAETERDTARTSVKMLTQSRASLQRELSATRDIMTMTRNDLDRVQRELAELQTAAAASPPAPAPPAVTPPTESKKPDNDDYTGTEARFALLELD